MSMMLAAEVGNVGFVSRYHGGSVNICLELLKNIELITEIACASYSPRELQPSSSECHTSQYKASVPDEFS